MKTKEKANETTADIPHASRVTFQFGNLRTWMWEEEDGWRLVILREQANGELADHELTPSDLEDLAQTTAFIAGYLNEFGELPGGLSDDLGCLGHCLASALGIRFDAEISFPDRINGSRN